MLANGVRLIIGSICMMKSIGTKSVLITLRRINFKETRRSLVVDRKLLNASNPFVFSFILSKSNCDKPWPR